MLLGVVSDTHGLVRPEALAALRGVDRILHAGDVGRAEVLDALREIAPVDAVRGNVDRGPGVRGLPARCRVEAAGARILVLHRLADLDVDPVAEGVAVVVTGHSHVPRLEARGGVLYLNPGSIGPHRFRLPVSLARLRVEAGRVSGELVVLDPRGGRPQPSSTTQATVITTAPSTLTPTPSRAISAVDTSPDP